MMAEVLSSMHDQVGQMQQGKGHMGMPPPDERDAYIGWLKSEFAAANALIDSMCHHMRSIGGPGEYDLVFGCLNRRRHAWTPSLYMQHFFSVAEVVTALQDVGRKKQQGVSSSSHANVVLKACPSCRAHAEEAHAKAQLGSNERRNAHSNLAANSVVESQGTKPGRIECFSTISNKDENGSVVTATPETGEVQTSHSPDSALSNSAESSIIERDEKASYILLKSSSRAHICDSRDQMISFNNTKGHVNDHASLFNIKGLHVKELLNTEISIASKEEDARQTMIKRSMQFKCCGHVDGQKIDDGESVELCERVFNNKEIGEIIGIIDQLQAAGRQGELGGAFRGCKKSSCLPDIIQFGPKLGNETKTNDSPCIPKFLQGMIRWLASCDILSPKRSPDSCLISIFDEGSFEAPNTDQGAWEKPLCVISLLEDCSMVFGHSITTDQNGSCKGPFQVALTAGSVLLLRENFTGILQKAITASPSRRITIALGKAVSTSRAELHWGIGGEKLPPNLGVWPHQRWLRLPGHMQFPFPSMQPTLPRGLVLPPRAMALPRLLGSSGGGTGVFFPSCDISWQSGVLLLSSTSLVASSGSVPSKRVGKHAGVKGAFDLTGTKAPKKKLGKVAPRQEVDDGRALLDNAASNHISCKDSICDGLAL